MQLRYTRTHTNSLGRTSLSATMHDTGSCRLVEAVCRVPLAMQSDCEICFCTICLLSSKLECRLTAFPLLFPAVFI